MLAGVDFSLVLPSVTDGHYEFVEPIVLAISESSLNDKVSIAVDGTTHTLMFSGTGVSDKSEGTITLTLNSNEAGQTKTYTVNFEVMQLEFASAVDPITVVVGYDTEFVYPEVVADGSVAMSTQFPLQSLTVTPTGITADQFTFTENTRTIVVHGGVNFASLIGETISLALTLTNQAGDTHVYQ